MEIPPATIAHMMFRNSRFPNMVFRTKRKRKRPCHKRAHHATEERKRVDRNRLSEREKQVIYYVRDFQYERRRPPYQIEISEFFGFSRPASLRYVKKLLKRGLLEISSDDAAKGRGLILFPKGTKFPWDDTTQFPSDIFFPRP